MTDARFMRARIDANFAKCNQCQKEYLKEDLQDGICHWCIELPRQMKAAEGMFRADLCKKLGGIRALTYTFETFTGTAGTAVALKAAEAFDPARGNLYLSGECGTGKTHLATAVINRLVTLQKKYDQYDAKFQMARFLFTQPATILRQMRGTDGETERRIIEDHGSAKCLVLDDLGSERYTDYAAQSLYEIVNYRYMHDLNGLIVTSNLSMDSLASKLGDDRIPSRLSEMCQVVTLGGGDYRIQKGRR